MNNHGVSRRCFTEADVKDFKSGALRATTNITRTGFELSVSRSRNAIYFCIIAIPKKSHFTNFAIQNFVQNTRTCEFHLYCWDHVCKVNEWCLVDCFHREFRVSTQIKVCDYYTPKYKHFCACGGLLMVLQAIFFVIENICLNYNPAGIW